MATSYDGSTGLTTLLTTGLISKSVFDAISKDKKASYQEVASTTGAITQGTDVAYYSTGGSVDLTNLGIITTKGVKDLNALVFSTNDAVDLTLPAQFKGSVVFGGGNDTLDAELATKALEINAGAGNDDITTGSGNDSVKGGDGNDTITTGDGKDQVAGGTGDDEIRSGAGNDSVSGGSGNDFIDAGDGNDYIVGGAGNDEISAGIGKDTIFAGSGQDTVDAGEGNDLIVITGNAGATDVEGGAGKDTLDLSYADDIVSVSGTIDNGGDVVITLNDGSTLHVTNIENFIGDFNQDGVVDTVKLVGLDDFFTS